MKSILRRTAIVFFALFVFAGCATGPKFTGVSEPAAGKGVVYVYRPSLSFGSMGCSKFSIDGGEVHPMPNGEYVRLELPKGPHLLKSEVSWCAVYPLERAFTLDAGEVLFIKLNLHSRRKPGFVRYAGPDDDWHGFEIVPPQLAIEEMKAL